MADRMSDVEIQTAMGEIAGWSRDGIWIRKTFVQKGFVGAVDFVQKIVPVAEGMDHHPDVRIFGYKRVEISISTHSAGGLTAKDFDLAQKIDALAS